MLFKLTTLAVLATSALVSAQTFQLTPCSQCMLGTIPKEKTCQSLVPVDQQQLQAAFANGTVDPGVFLTAGKNPAIQNCLCNWYATALSPTGNGAACVAPGANGAAPICNATETADAATQMKPISTVLNCANATAPAGNSTATPPPTTGTTASGVASVGVPMVLSVAALAIAAAIGF
ncbi:hypothetical protein CPC16_010914 [Podila verticillata]|nr:hypothetical protein BGZ52_004319 [Haplosporangium bisporale]KAF9209078.1 hypothetical protein BGZ59_010295 [Podila verticillata]KAF9379137.1 hypothetical protein CPC16_010914 [Podila verticillata]